MNVVWTRDQLGVDRSAVDLDNARRMPIKKPRPNVIVAAYRQQLKLAAQLEPRRGLGHEVRYSTLKC